MGNRTISQSGTANQAVEEIQHEGRLLCMLIRAEPVPVSTTFYTPEDHHLQFGKIVYAANGKVASHSHRNISRNVVGSSEVLVVQKGRMLLNIFADDQTLHASREMGPGDVVILMAGGHGIHFMEDTVLLEVKQGPYHGTSEKEYF